MGVTSALVCLLAAADAGSSGARGTPQVGVETWEGVLADGNASLRVLFHLRTLRDGTLEASLDSPDQHAWGLYVDEVWRDGRTLRFVLRKLGASFDGRSASDTAVMVGTWTQGGESIPLTLRRLILAPEKPRREEPHLPPPYEEREVHISTTGGPFTLAGTLTIPSGVGPFPGVLLLSGSGPQDRDETIAGHRPFRVAADHLARHGIAVLRLDDRGVGGSGGDKETTIEDRSEDAFAAVTFLLSAPRVDARRVGILGHSEGGLVAVQTAVRSEAVAFVILLASPAVRGDQLLLAQTRALLHASGASEEAIEQASALNRSLYRIALEERDAAVAEARIREELGRLGMEKGRAGKEAAALTSRSVRSFLRYDPGPDLGRLRVPVLAAWGERDRQVPAAENVAALRQAIASTAALTTTIYPGLNHLFQASRSGLPAEYEQLKDGLSTELLEQVSAWIRAAAGKTAQAGRR